MLFLGPDNAYPRFIGDVQVEYPNYKEGDTPPNGWFLVEETEYPEAEADKAIEEVLPVLVDGVYKQTFNIRPLTADEIEKRNAPITAKAKLTELGFTDAEIQALVRGLIR